MYLFFVKSIFAAVSKFGNVIANGYAYYISQKAQGKGNTMFINSERKVAFITDSIDDALFIANSREYAEKVFVAWLEENLAWVNAGADEDTIEIVGVDFELVEFNNQVIISYLCSGCADNSCENEDEVHEEIVSHCRFTETLLVEEQRR